MNHRAEAEKYLKIDAETGSTSVGRDALGAAEVHALLDIAAALRELNETMLNDGVRTVPLHG